MREIIRALDKRDQRRTIPSLQVTYSESGTGGAFNSPEEVVKSINGLINAVTLAAGKNASLEVSGQTITVTALLPFAEGTHSGINFAYRSGIYRDGTAVTKISAGTIALTDNATNYVEIDVAAGTVTANTTGFSEGNIPLYEVVTVSGEITTVTDRRAFVQTGAGGSGDGGGAYAETIGDGSATTFNVTHNLGTTDVAVALWDLTATDPLLATGDASAIEAVDTNTVRVTFASPPSVDSYRVVVLSAGAGGLPAGQAKGDLPVFDGAQWDRLGAGTDGQVLKADSAAALGLSWGAAGGGGGYGLLIAQDTGTGSIISGVSGVVPLNDVQVDLLEEMHLFIEYMPYISGDTDADVYIIISPDGGTTWWYYDAEYYLNLNNFPKPPAGHLGRRIRSSTSNWDNRQRALAIGTFSSGTYLIRLYVATNDSVDFAEADQLCLVWGKPTAG